MLQYSRTPEMGPFPGHGWKGVSFRAVRSVSRGGCLCALPGGCRRGWPGGGKNLPSGRPPMDCGICRTKSPAVNKMFCVGVFPAYWQHICRGGRGACSFRGRRRTAGLGGGRFKKLGNRKSNGLVWNAAVLRGRGGNPAACGGMCCGEGDFPGTS